MNNHKTEEKQSEERSKQADHDLGLIVNGLIYLDFLMAKLSKI